MYLYQANQSKLLNYSHVIGEMIFFPQFSLVSGAANFRRAPGASQFEIVQGISYKQPFILVQQTSANVIMRCLLRNG